MTNSLSLKVLNTIHLPGFPKRAIAGSFSLGAKQRLLSVKRLLPVKCVAAKQKSNELDQTWPQQGHTESYTRRNFFK
jgi:hypothetical protein